MSSLVDKIIHVLTPDLGATMAVSSVKMFIKMEGIPVKELGRQDLPNLVKKLKPGLTVFVGNVKADHLAKKILSLKEEGSP